MLVKKEVSSNSSFIYRKKFILLLTGAVLFAILLLISQQPVKAADIVVYKSPTCGCCKGWVKHMKANGYSVEVRDKSNLNSIKQELGVPKNLQSCHTATIGNYIIEGHVPASDVARLLKEKPDVKGLTAPGMPMGSPGMEGPRKDPYNVLTFDKKGSTNVFARHNRR